MFYGTYYPMLASPMLLCLCKHQVPIAFVFNIISFILWLRQMDIKRAFNKSHSGINSFLSLLFFWKSLQKKLQMIQKRIRCNISFILCAQSARKKYLNIFSIWTRRHKRCFATPRMNNNCTCILQMRKLVADYKWQHFSTHIYHWFIILLFCCYIWIDYRVTYTENKW